MAHLPVEQVDWIWEGFIGKGLLTLLASAPKVGKSTLLWHFLQSMYNEQSFLGKTVRPVPTVIFTEESYATLTNRRDSLHLETKPIHCVTIQPNLNWANLIAYSKERIQRHGAGLLVLDTVSRFWSLHSEDDAAEQLRVLSPLFLLARYYSAGILLIHHTRKSRGAGGRAVRGSNALTGAVDIIVEFDRLSPYDVSNSRRMDCLSRFDATPDRLVAELGPEGYHTADPAGAGLEASVMRLVASQEDSTAAMLAEELDVSERQVQRVLAQLTARGILTRHGSGAASSPFMYTMGGAEDG